MALMYGIFVYFTGWGLFLCVAVALGFLLYYQATHIEQLDGEPDDGVIGRWWRNHQK